MYLENSGACMPLHSFMSMVEVTRFLLFLVIDDRISTTGHVLRVYCQGLLLAQVNYDYAEIVYLTRAMEPNRSMHRSAQ